MYHAGKPDNAGKLGNTGKLMSALGPAGEIC